MQLDYRERHTDEIRTEKIAGETFVKWSYENKAGNRLMTMLLNRKWFSSLAGVVQDRRFSRKRVAAFIREMNIDLSEADRETPEAYCSFNDFFTRQLKPEARPVHSSQHRLVSPADGRLLAYQSIRNLQMLQIKGQSFTISDLLQNEQQAEMFKNGSAIVIRLSPVDYHRFHFPCDGIPGPARTIKGRYDSVNPVALKAQPGIYCRNRRDVTMMKTLEAGNMAFIEVGATLVGSICQTYSAGMPVSKGMEKGYFQFGGSTVILLFENGKIKIDDDLLNNTEAGYETLVKMGEAIADITNQ
ncbi:phosphatidylserine decarboxylase [Anoxynatronum buryatiense]|uniref:phosphatidylserine decarboxylase n=1 Tax=Anoxynatronum buryatiense TaxID=489973 RepID=A0AA46AHZ7_9CLOT|nr:phosphatidylserine decarboxylase [Anoxynatronum buryatiense]SMP44793.1 phosphatidylserine decarboxylase [Anoxynatronum buryatiense]